VFLGGNPTGPLSDVGGGGGPHGQTWHWKLGDMYNEGERGEEKKNMNYFIIISSRRISIYVAGKIIRNETNTFYIVPMKLLPLLLLLLLLLLPFSYMYIDSM
jgi:hypothetical protein